GPFRRAARELVTLIEGDAVVGWIYVPVTRPVRWVGDRHKVSAGAIADAQARIAKVMRLHADFEDQLDVSRGRAPVDNGARIPQQVPQLTVILADELPPQLRVGDARRRVVHLEGHQRRG